MLAIETSTEIFLGLREQDTVSYLRAMTTHSLGVLFTRYDACRLASLEPSLAALAGVNLSTLRT